MIGRLKRHNAKFRKKIAYHTKRKPVYRRRLQSNKRVRTSTGWASASGSAAGMATAAVRRITTRLRNRKRSTTTPVNAMQELTKSTKRVRIQKYSMPRIVNATVDKNVARFQQLSNFDTNVGAVWLDNHQYTSGVVQMPMVIIDLGSQHQPLITAIQPPALVQPVWNNATVSSDISIAFQPGQNPDGTVTGNANFQYEESNLMTPTPTTLTTGVLNWVNLRLNLYGQRKRTTKFVITIFQVTDDEVDPVNGSPTSLDRKALFQYLERPFIYSNLQQDVKMKKTGFKTIKEFTYNVAPMTSIDLNTTTGNIHEANINMQINKRMDYMYNQTASTMLPHAQVDGLDYNQNTAANTVHQSPKVRQNVFVAIRAFAPIRTYDTEALGPLRSADNSPSFDIICRRSFTFPS